MKITAIDELRWVLICSKLKTLLFVSSLRWRHDRTADSQPLPLPFVNVYVCCVVAAVGWYLVLGLAWRMEYWNKNVAMQQWTEFKWNGDLKTSVYRDHNYVHWHNNNCLIEKCGSISLYYIDLVYQLIMYI